MLCGRGLPIAHCCMAPSHGQKRKQHLTWGSLLDNGMAEAEPSTGSSPKLRPHIIILKFPLGQQQQQVGLAGSSPYLSSSWKSHHSREEGGESEQLQQVPAWLVSPPAQMFTANMHSPDPDGPKRESHHLT